MPDSPSASDLLREHINKKLDEKYDYSTKPNRTADIKEAAEKYPELKKLSSLPASHNKILKQCLKNHGIDSRTMGLNKKIVKFHSDMIPEITPQPQPSNPNQNKPPVLASKAQYQLDDKGKPVLGQDGKPILLEQRVNYNNFDAEGVGATFQALFVVLRMTIPEIEMLTDREKESLGKMWLPAFQRYLSENWQIIGIPTLATLAMIIPKVSDGRKKKKKREELEEKQEAEKDNQRRCEHCNKTFKKSEIEKHKMECSEKK